jgi:hypothetical protein
MKRCQQSFECMQSLRIGGTRTRVQDSRETSTTAESLDGEMIQSQGRAAMCDEMVVLALGTCAAED